MEVNLKECEAWLQPLGYSVFSHAGNRTRYTFSPDTREGKKYYPLISIESRNGELRVGMHAPLVFKLFINLSIEGLQFKHPEIGKYIKAFEHYTRLADQIPPQL